MMLRVIEIERGTAFPPLQLAVAVVETVWFHGQA